MSAAMLGAARLHGWAAMEADSAETVVDALST